MTMIPYTKKYYLDTIEKGVKKVLSSTSIPVGQLEEMVYMIGELKKDSTEEDNDDYDLTELRRDELHRRCREMCDIIGGEDAYDRFEHDELMDMLKEMSTSHEEYTNLQECNDAKEAHELFYQTERCGSL